LKGDAKAVPGRSGKGEGKKGAARQPTDGGGYAVRLEADCYVSKKRKRSKSIRSGLEVPGVGSIYHKG